MLVLLIDLLVLCTGVVSLRLRRGWGRTCSIVAVTGCLDLVI